MLFIEVNSLAGSGRKLLVNVAHITSIGSAKPDEAGPSCIEILGIEDALSVKETYDQLQRKLREFPEIIIK